MNDLVIPEKIDPNSNEFKAIVAGLLKRIDPTKGFGTVLYKAIARLSWNCYWESVALRYVVKEVEVFMTKRDETDPDWNGYWHVPGTALRPGDTEETAKARLAKEYGVPVRSLKRVGDAGFGWFKSGDEGRGPGISFVFDTTFDGEPALNEWRRWFNVKDLPTPTVPSHISQIIPMAVRAFDERHGW